MRRRACFVAALSMCLAATDSVAQTQQVKADAGSIAIGGSVNSSTINIGISVGQLTALVKQANELSETQKKLISNLEGQLDLNYRQISAALEILGEANVPPERLAAKLVEIAEQFKALRESASVQPNDGTEIAALKVDAKKAIDAGELVKADGLLASAEATQKSDLEHLALNLAITFAQRGEIARTRLRYNEAVKYFASATAAIPETDAYDDLRMNYLEREADTLRRQGDEFGDNVALRSAIDRYGKLLELRSRERAPLDWAATQHDLGWVFQLLGERESGNASLEHAIAAYRKALIERTRTRVPLAWAQTQNNLANALITLGSRESGTTTLEQALAAHQQALSVRSRERVPLDWAQSQSNLCLTFDLLAFREKDLSGMDKAIIACREALKEYTREHTPLDWARTQTILGAVFTTLGARESDTERLEEAVAAYREALKVDTRDRFPLVWAKTESMLGTTLATLGTREGGTGHLEEAVVAFRER